jgi:hypothetical protein
MYNQEYANFIGLFYKKNWLGSKEKALKKIDDYYIAYNIDINSRPTPYDKITMYYAGEVNNIDLAKYLLEKRGGSVLAFLNTVVLDDFIKGIDKLIKQGVNPQALYKSAFIHGSAQGALDIVKYALEKDSSIHDDLAIKLACKNNRLEVVKYLLNKGYHITEKDLINSSKKVDYDYTINYFSDDESYFVCAYLLKNYQFDNINAISDEILTNILSDFRTTAISNRLYSFKAIEITTLKYHNVCSIITNLLITRRVPLSEKNTWRLKKVKVLAGILEKRQAIESWELKQSEIAQAEH